MNNIRIIHANKNHKDFLIYANKVIDNVNNMNETNGLSLNIDKDYFCDNPKFQCLVAEVIHIFIELVMIKFYGFNKCLLNQNMENMAYFLN